MVALEMLRGQWLIGMLLLGGVLSWMLYLAHYGTPGSDPEAAEGDAPGDDDPPGGHEFAEGLREGDLPVPVVLRVFFLGMFVFAVGYVLWVRAAIGSY